MMPGQRGGEALSALVAVRKSHQWASTSAAWMARGGGDGDGSRVLPPAGRTDWNTVLPPSAGEVEGEDSAPPRCLLSVFLGTVLDLLCRILYESVGKVLVSALILILQTTDRFQSNLAGDGSEKQQLLGDGTNSRHRGGAESSPSTSPADGGSTAFQSDLPAGGSARLPELPGGRPARRRCRYQRMGQRASRDIALVGSEARTD
uniref:Uncharacterized protein n=1 Tax=Oryza sativa subsp. japonica TaxID=39947 RepID=Q6ZLM1_ORYSJ|nr:hypothetical protein [Oryza sativa Japonica Group]